MTIPSMTPQQIMDDQKKMVQMAAAIMAIRPGAQFTVSVDGYDTLQWHDDAKSKPSKEEFDAAMKSRG